MDEDEIMERPMCDAVRSYPPTGALIRCTERGGGHAWHTTGPPARMLWPAQPLGCPAWHAVQTRKGDDVVVVCALPVADSHDRHEAVIGVIPVRWSA